MQVIARIFFLLVFFLIVAKIPVHASRIMGADISYQWISGNTFQVNLSVYRDCSSENPLPNRQKVYFSSFSCRPTQDSISMLLTGNPIDVTPLCNREPSNCSGGNNPGIQRYRYQGTVNLPLRCSDWVFYFRQCNRSAVIGTLVNPQNNCLYIEATLNNVWAQNNSSAKIGNDPISFLCVGQAVNYNPGISDANGDQLKFKLVTPRTNSLIPNVQDLNVVNFKPGFSTNYPMPCVDGFGFDTTNGQFSFTPAQVISGATAVKISEYRNGKLIGSMMFDFPLFARNCENRIPALSGFDNEPIYQKLVCIGDTLRTGFVALDENEGDSLRFTWNSNLPDSLFTADSTAGISKAQIQWIPTILDTGSKTFSITVTDDACPAKASTTKTYVLNIRQKPEIIGTSDTLIPCGETIPISVSVVKGIAPFQFSWPGTNSQTSTITAGHGKYIVRVKDASGCFAQDSIWVKGSSISGDIQIDTSCLVEGVQLKAIPFSINPNLTYTYKWTFPPETQSYTGEVVRKKFTEPGIKNVSLKITGSDNCSIVIPGNTYVCPPPPVLSVYAPNVCQGQIYRIGCGIPGRGGICGASTICVILKDRNWVNFPLTGELALPPDSLRPDSNTFEIITYSLNHCRNSRLFKFKVKPVAQVKVKMTSSNIVYNCNRPDTTVLIKIFKDYRYITDSIWGKITLCDTVIHLPKTVQDTIRYTLHLSKPCNIITIKGIMADNCNAYWTFGYVPSANAQINFSPHCLATDTVAFYTNIASSVLNSYSFNLGNGIITTDTIHKVFYPPGQIFKGYFAVEDNLGCLDTNFFTVDTRLPDTTVVLSSDTSCLFSNARFRIIDTTIVNEWKFSYLDEFRILNSFHLVDSLPMTIPGYASIGVRISYKQGCGKNWLLPPVYVRKAIIPKINLSNVCAYDSSRFAGSIVFSEFPVQSWNWKYNYPASVNPGFSVDSVQNPIRKFGYNGRFRSFLTVFDQKGCAGKDTLDSTMVLVSKPEFDVNGDCQNDSLIFFFGKVPDEYENIDRFTYLYNDGKVETTGNGQGLHQFNSPGTYEVTLIANSVEGCSNRDTNTLVIKPRPKADFNLPPPEICQGQVFRVDGSNSKPATPDQKLTSFIWATNEENPYSSDTVTDISIVEAGNAYVALQVRSTNGCQDYLKIPFVARPRPVPDFAVNEEELRTSDRVSFLNQSIGSTMWKWDFGDGSQIFVTDSLILTQTHNYTTGKEFQVKLWVTNSFACSDSVTKEVNLKSYIALPNAFSPNGDDRNDQFGLIHRYIRNLEEFKVYNRLGQLVFDAGKNLESRWDGGLEGKAQPNGNYLYYAKALSVFGELLELKGSLTLIR